MVLFIHRIRCNIQNGYAICGVIKMKLGIVIEIEDREIKVAVDESYEITCKKESMATIMIGD